MLHVLLTVLCAPLGSTQARQWLTGQRLNVSLLSKKTALLSCLQSSICSEFSATVHCFLDAVSESLCSSSPPPLTSHSEVFAVGCVLSLRCEDQPGPLAGMALHASFLHLLAHRVSPCSLHQLTYMYSACSHLCFLRISATVVIHYPIICGFEVGNSHSIKNSFEILSVFKLN